MNFANDRDLLAFEPNLFRDVPFFSQQRLTASDAAVTGTTLASAAADFAALAISVGDIVLVDDQPLEVLSRQDAHTLSVSQLRASLLDDAIAPTPAADAKLMIRTFTPQITIVHESLLRIIGLPPPLSL